MSNSTSWIILGLKGVGKTTYLAALWHQLEAGETQTEITVEGLQPDRSYLNRIRDAWLALEDVPRTSMRTEHGVSLKLRTPTGELAVNFVDPSGETLAAMWLSRRATKE